MTFAITAALNLGIAASSIQGNLHAVVGGTPVSPSKLISPPVGENYLLEVNAVVGRAVAQTQDIDIAACVLSLLEGVVGDNGLPDSVQIRGSAIEFTN